MKRISVIIPMFNSMWYAESSINSALDQVCDSDTQIEVLVIDDGSTDKSFSTVQSMFSQFDNVKLYKNKKNMGIGFSRNYGLQMARGRYVYFLDSDDYIHKCTLLTLVNIIDSLDESYIGVKTNYCYVDDDDKRSESICSISRPIACGILYKKSMLLNIGGCDAKLVAFEEAEMFQRIKRANKEIAHIPVPFYRYRMHDSNHTKKIDVAEQYNKYIEHFSASLDSTK